MCCSFSCTYNQLSSTSHNFDTLSIYYREHNVWSHFVLRRIIQVQWSHSVDTFCHIVNDITKLTQMYVNTSDCRVCRCVKKLWFTNKMLTRRHKVLTATLQQVSWWSHQSHRENLKDCWTAIITAKASKQLYIFWSSYRQQGCHDNSCSTFILL